jgi:hypothetical protein
MVAQMKAPGGNAIHRTWLAKDGSGKAPVAEPKMLLGSCYGGAIQLYKAGAHPINRRRNRKCPERHPTINHGLRALPECLRTSQCQPAFGTSLSLLTMMGQEYGRPIMPPTGGDAMASE